LSPSTEAIAGVSAVGIETLFVTIYPFWEYSGVVDIAGHVGGFPDKPFGIWRGACSHRSFWLAVATSLDIVACFGIQQGQLAQSFGWSAGLGWNFSRFRTALY